MERLKCYTTEHDELVLESARTGFEIRCVDGSDLEEVKEMMHVVAEYIKEGTDVIFE